MQTLQKKKQVAPRLALAAILVAGLVLSACSGAARINVDVDPDTGQGTIDINGQGDASGGQQDGGSGDGGSNGGGQVAISDAVIFATVIALFLGVLAIVVSTANRSRYRE